MTYEFPVDTAALFGERRPQFINLGLPAEDVDRTAARITEMWADAPGGWTYEFSSLASEYADRGEHYRAALAYGAAKFPSLANDARRTALRHQLEQYTSAAPGFGAHFERRILELPYRDGTISVPVHLLSADDDYAARPVLIASGGLDTWKMDLHDISLAFVRGAGVTVMGFDHPGTGETEAPLDAHADEVIDGLIAEARRLGNGRAGHFGLSYGGNFAAASGLRGAVDAAIDLGGPIVDSFEKENFQHLMFGMKDIAGNAFGFTTAPTPDEIMAASKPFIRADLLARDDNSPMLIVNGADDVHITASDTLTFSGRRDTEVHLIPGTGHVAASKLPEVLPLITTWLRNHLV
ncbi:alpha/beta hydrolase [Nocardia sp. NPDC059246]|uniref:alpha/beta hydrolase n=1 Tax=unclassified Nocardia TaxID=2637762 RepID=UPI0036D0C1CE